MQSACPIVKCVWRLDTGGCVRLAVAGDGVQDHHPMIAPAPMGHNGCDPCAIHARYILRLRGYPFHHVTADYRCSNGKAPRSGSGSRKARPPVARHNTP